MSAAGISNYIGIDPGKSGAVALIEYQHGRKISVDATDTPILPAAKGKKSIYDPAGMVRLLKRWSGPDTHVFIEQVHSMPGQGVSSTFDFGKGFGMWLGILAALQIPHTIMTPQRWKKAMLADMTQDKNASRARAAQLFPEAAELFAKVKDDGRAEALLMAEYGRRQLTA
jgi:crossover junction endodeoxyribonuclease RuvC